MVLKYKSPGPDGWPIEFYLHFFELLGGYLLLIIEESRTSGRKYDGFNSTFIALIPEHDHLESFHDYKPISLCNCIYKIISKIIANRIKPILSDHIAKEKFSFLHHRQIHEAIGTAQEVLHSIKTKNLKSTILKIDLAKAFDHVNWNYLHLILIQTSFSPPFINWIMVVSVMLLSAFSLMGLHLISFM